MVCPVVEDSLREWTKVEEVEVEGVEVGSRGNGRSGSRGQKLREQKEVERVLVY